MQLVDRGSHADTNRQRKLVSKLTVVIRSSTMSFGVNTLVIDQGGHTDERMESTIRRNRRRTRLPEPTELVGQEAEARVRQQDE